MSVQKRGLGRGLGALIPSASHGALYEEIIPAAGGRSVINVDILKIVPNPRQPRKYFNESNINELSDSIKEQGLAQPVLVRHKGEKFELIAGERRWRAAKKAGFSSIPAIIKDFSDEQALEIALIENIQRQDLGPIEEALAYKMLYQDFNLTHEQIAKKISKDRSTVSNSLRLLELPVEIQDSINREEISAGHARALLGVPGRDKQITMWKEILKNNLSVRDIEAILSGRKNADNKQNLAVVSKKSKSKRKHLDPHMMEAQEKLTETLGTKVDIHGSTKKGKILINYYSQEDLERILEEITD